MLHREAINDLTLFSVLLMYGIGMPHALLGLIPSEGEAATTGVSGAMNDFLSIFGIRIIIASYLDRSSSYSKHFRHRSCPVKYCIWLVGFFQQLPHLAFGIIILRLDD